MKPEITVGARPYAGSSTPPDVIKNGVKRRRILDRIAEKLIFGVALIAITIIFLIFVYVAREALPILSRGAALRPLLRYLLSSARFWECFSWRGV